MEKKYLAIADQLETQIKDGILRAGEKMPSVRNLCREKSISMSTAQLVYSTLVGKSLIEAKSKSGYFVSGWINNKLEIPQISSPDSGFSKNTADDLITKVFDTINNKNITQLSLGIPSGELIPINQLNQLMKKSVQDLTGCGTEYEQIEGNINLRRSISRWAYNSGSRFREGDIITTNGCINAVSYCLMALTKPGDTIAVESPTYFGILQLIKNLGLNILELPTNAESGIDLDVLKKHLQRDKISVCLLISNFNNPLGSCIPDNQKKEIVDLLTYYNVPLIEDDIYGDLYFGKSRPKSCKSFDEAGNVLWCSSISKSLAPGYRVGWVAPGKFKKDIIRLKTFHSISSVSLTEQVISTFIDSGKYEIHLRKMRRVLQSNAFQFMRVISEFFPDDIKITKPEGSMFLWLELNKKNDAVEIFNKALKSKISIAPGRLFTSQNQFNNYMRLSYALTWTKQLEKDLIKLSKFIK